MAEQNIPRSSSSESRPEHPLALRAAVLAAVTATAFGAPVIDEHTHMIDAVVDVVIPPLMDQTLLQRPNADRVPDITDPGMHFS